MLLIHRLLIFTRSLHDYPWQLNIHSSLKEVYLLVFGFSCTVKKAEKYMYKLTACKTTE